jgi:hypothetical protein
MADLAQSAVTVRETWKEGGTNARKFLAKAVTLTLTGQGTANSGERIAASLFGMNKIWSVRDARTSDEAMLIASPSYDGSYILLSSVGPVATEIFEANAVTGTVRLTVLGKE